MSNILYLQDFIKQRQSSQPRRITFYSPIYQRIDGQMANFNITLNLQNGSDIESLIQTAREIGGLGVMGEDGIYRFMPYPCAMIEIRDI